MCSTNLKLPNRWVHTALRKGLGPRNVCIQIGASKIILQGKAWHRAQNWVTERTANKSISMIPDFTSVRLIWETVAVRGAFQPSQSAA
jgi:hypothetical protein